MQSSACPFPENLIVFLAQNIINATAMQNCHVPRHRYQISLADWFEPSSSGCVGVPTHCDGIQSSTFQVDSGVYRTLSPLNGSLGHARNYLCNLVTGDDQVVSVIYGSHDLFPLKHECGKVPPQPEFSQYMFGQIAVFSDPHVLLFYR